MPIANLDGYNARIKTPFATLGILADDDYLRAIHFLPASVSAKPPVPDTIAHLTAVQLMLYLENPRYRFDLPIRMSGSKHQIDVWRAMQAIPAGQTQTYGQIAHTIGSNARAVGAACGKNPVPVVVPCHRVVAANGLGGFMGGLRGENLAIKHDLLVHEGALIL